MKLVVLLILASLFQVQAKSYAQKITLSKNNVSIIEVFREIKRQTDYNLICNSRIIKETPPVSLNVKDVSLKETLDKLLIPNGLYYAIEGNSIVVKRVHVPIASKEKHVVLQQRRITGKVINEKGQVIQGASVMIKGTSIGTTTDNNGSYSITLPLGNNTLVFSFIGYATQERLADSDIVDVTMIEEAAALGEVVVVGFGTQKKVNLTGAVSTVKFDKELENRPITNASQALGGKVSGLWISQNSGKPGNDGALLRVRGWGTLNDATPMVLVDGVEGSIAQLNPKDIESISVLKDAASAAIYGSKAANGVVLITTKSGKYNQKIKINLSSYAGLQSLARKFDIVDNSAKYMELWNQALINHQADPIFPTDVINNFKNNNDPYNYPNTNFFDEVYRNAVISEHNLSLSGGSEDSKYFVSLNRLKQDGIMKGTDGERYGLNLTIESKVKEWLNIGGRLNAMHTVANEPYNIGRVAYVFANGAYPFIPPYNKDGSFGAVQALDSNGEMIVGNRNPMIEAFEGLTKNEHNFTKMNAFADLILTDYLTLKSNFTAQYNSDLIDKYNELKVGYTSTGIKAPNLDFGQVPLLASRSNENTANYSWFNTLNFNKQFAEKHDVSVVAGMQIESFILKSTYGRKSDPAKAGLTQIDAGTSGEQVGGNMSAFRMLSYFGRANYAYLNRYLFEMNVRSDASSRFKEGHRWATFPGFSAGWRLSEEPFIKDLGIFSELKLRGSWGKLGNQNGIGYWPYLTVIDQNNSLSANFGGAFAPGAAVTSLVDEGISWETTTSSDIGLDLGFLNNRLLVGADYFSKITNDIIVRLPIPLTLGGLNAPYENVGEMTNKGIELDINYSNEVTDRDQVRYSLGANFTYVKNRVTKFRGGKSPDQLYLIREGYSYRTLYAFDTEGIYRTDQEASEHMYANGYVPQAGDLKYRDLNEDGKIDYNDMTEIGNTIPKYTFGANFNFSYKGFDLGILMQGMAGVNVDTKSAWTQPFGISGAVVTKRWENAWTPENTQTDIPILKINDTWNRQNSSFWITDLSFLKVKNIQLGYTLPSSLINRLGLDNLYLYANAQNVFTFVNKEYEGFDPERSTFDAGYSTYPLPRIVSLGLNVSF